MNAPAIKPTVGRRVWFRPSDKFLASNPILTQFNPEQPMDAGIVYVHHDHMVNLIVTDHVGKTLAVPSVPLLAGQYVADEDAGVYCCCEWMPYQKSQAAKTEVAENAAAPVLCLKPGEPVNAVPNAALARAIAAQDAFVQLASSAYADLHAVDPLEREIQAKADKGPRVTPADVEAEISAEYSFTLDKALAGCPLFDGSDRVTIAVLVLKNGAKLVGVNYGAIDPAQHSPEMGAKEARAAAVEQIWPLLGFRLRDELARPVLTDADAAADLAGTPRPDNPTAEAADFLASVKPCDLSGDAPCEACQ